MTRIAICGAGNIGRVHVENLLSLRGCEVTGVFDTRPETLEGVCRDFGVAAYAGLDDLLGDSRVDAVVVATPSDSHEEVAVKAFEAGKHVFIEKPMTRSVVESQRLIAEAEKRNLVIMVDHTFVYTPAVRKIRELIASDQLGEIYYYDSTRVNRGLFQSDVNVIWDLAAEPILIRAQ